MILKEIYGIDSDGQVLDRVFSDKNVRIRRKGTTQEYDEVINTNVNVKDFEETNIAVPIMEDITEFEQWKI